MEQNEIRCSSVVTDVMDFGKNIGKYQIHFLFLLATTLLTMMVQQLQKQNSYLQEYSTKNIITRISKAKTSF